MERKGQAEVEGIGMCYLETGPIGLPDERVYIRGGRLLRLEDYIEIL